MKEPTIDSDIQWPGSMHNTSKAKKSESIFQTAPRFPKENFVWKFSTLRPFVLLVQQHVDEDTYGALVEWYWQGEMEVLDKSLSQCHFAHHKCDMDWLGSNPGLRNDRQATDRLSHGTDWLKAKRERERERERERDTERETERVKSKGVNFIWGGGGESEHKFISRFAGFPRSYFW